MLEMSYFFARVIACAVSVFSVSLAFGQTPKVEKVSIPEQNLYCVESFNLSESEITNPVARQTAFNALEGIVVAEAFAQKLKSTGLPYSEVREVQIPPAAAGVAAASAASAAPPVPSKAWVLRVCSAVPSIVNQPANTSRVKLIKRPPLVVFAAVCDTREAGAIACRRAIADAAGIPALTNSDLSSKYRWLHIESIPGGDVSNVVIRSYSDTSLRLVDGKNSRPVPADAQIAIALVQ